MTSMLHPEHLFKLDGKVAVITGAASGIGKATAILFAAAGARVVVADKDLTRARQVAEDLGAEHVAIGFDLADDRSIIALFEQVARDMDGCDLLINNAGIFPRYSFDELTEPQWQEMQRINTWGCFQVMREATRLMRKFGRGGRIVNISSIGGIRTAVKNQTAYNASKAAIDSMTKSAAHEFAADGILVNSVCPGAVKPFESRPHEAGHTLPTGPLLAPGRILTGGAAEPHEIAGPVLMLASAAGGHFTGQCLIIDGGFSIS